MLGMVAGRDAEVEGKDDLIQLRHLATSMVIHLTSAPRISFDLRNHNAPILSAYNNDSRVNLAGSRWSATCSPVPNLILLESHLAIQPNAASTMMTLGQATWIFCSNHSPA